MSYSVLDVSRKPGISITIGVFPSRCYHNPGPWVTVSLKSSFLHDHEQKQSGEKATWVMRNPWAQNRLWRNHASELIFL